MSDRMRSLGLRAPVASIPRSHSRSSSGTRTEIVCIAWTPIANVYKCKRTYTLRRQVWTIKGLAHRADERSKGIERTFYCGSLSLVRPHVVRSMSHRFHPAIERWFASTFPAPTAPQLAAWPHLQAGRNVLVAAPTGSGKTLAAFLASIDELVRQAVSGSLADETQIVYVSPLKALSNDVERNLAAPLAGIRGELAKMGIDDVPIRTLVRTGDTPQTARAGMRRRPP